MEEFDNYKTYVWCEECERLYPFEECREYGVMTVVYDYVVTGNGKLIYKEISDAVFENPKYVREGYECPEGHDIPIDDGWDFISQKHIVLIKDGEDGITAKISGELVGEDSKTVEIKAKDVGDVEEYIRKRVVG